MPNRSTKGSRHNTIATALASPTAEGALPRPAVRALPPALGTICPPQRALPRNTSAFWSGQHRPNYWHRAVPAGPVDSVGSVGSGGPLLAPTPTMFKLQVAATVVTLTRTETHGGWSPMTWRRREWVRRQGSVIIGHLLRDRQESGFPRFWALDSWFMTPVSTAGKEVG